MRPATIHAAAQLVRHTRGFLTVMEKWVAATPPELLHEEIAQVIWLVRGGLASVNDTVGTSQPPAAPLSTGNQQR